MTRSKRSNLQTATSARLGNQAKMDTLPHGINAHSSFIEIKSAMTCIVKLDFRASSIIAVRLINLARQALVHFSPINHEKVLFQHFLPHTAARCTRPGCNPCRSRKTWSSPSGDFCWRKSCERNGNGIPPRLKSVHCKIGELDVVWFAEGVLPMLMLPLSANIVICRGGVQKDPLGKTASGSLQRLVLTLQRLQYGPLFKK